MKVMALGMVMSVACLADPFWPRLKYLEQRGSTTVVRITMKFGTNVHFPQNVNHNDFLVILCCSCSTNS